jgi:competence protein ComGC
MLNPGKSGSSWRPLVRALVVGFDVAVSKPCKGARSPSRGFTLVDLLVSIAVVGVLIAIMLPSLAGVRETAHQVVCRSNVRQLGFGLEMYAEANKQYIPRTITFLENGSDLSFQTMTLRFAPGDPEFVNVLEEQWDGLGLLFSEEYLPAQKLFYCPSHRGDHRYTQYGESWASDEGEIVGNFQFRGRGPTGRAGAMTFRLNQIAPYAALVVDGLRTQSDFNHQIGANVLRADLSVSWFVDQDRSISDSLPKDLEPPTPAQFQAVWTQFDPLSFR